MKLIELAKYGDYSVIMRSDDEGDPFMINPYVVAYKANIRDTEIVGWEYGYYIDDLFNAINVARLKGKDIIHYDRLEEIASKCLSYIANNSYEFVKYHDVGSIDDVEFITRELELTEDEMEYLGIEKELLEYEV